MNRNLETLRELIREKKILHDVEDFIVGLVQPSITVMTERIHDEADMPVGQSKIGGRPDMPAHIAWPKEKWRSKSLPFLTQFNLAEVFSYDTESVLPQTGMLYFFGDFYGGDEGVVLFYEDDLTDLKRREFPDDVAGGTPDESDHERFHPCSVTFLQDMSLPYFGLYQGNDYPDELKTRKNTYGEITMGFNYDTEPRVRNQLLGIANVPHDQLTECKAIENGADKFNPWSISNEEWELARSQKNEWRHLFELGSDDNAEMMWSDAGSLFFYIRRTDLAAKDFTNTCFRTFTS